MPCRAVAGVPHHAHLSPHTLPPHPAFYTLPLHASNTRYPLRLPPRPLRSTATYHPLPLPYHYRRWRRALCCG